MKTRLKHSGLWVVLWVQLIWANITGNPAGQAIASTYLELLKVLRKEAGGYNGKS